LVPYDTEFENMASVVTASSIHQTGIVANGRATLIDDASSFPILNSLTGGNFVLSGIACRMPRYRDTYEYRLYLAEGRFIVFSWLRDLWEQVRVEPG